MERRRSADTKESKKKRTEPFLCILLWGNTASASTCNNFALTRSFCPKGARNKRGRKSASHHERKRKENVFEARNMPQSTGKADGGIRPVLYKGESAQFPRSEIETFSVIGYAESELFFTQKTILYRRKASENI